MVAWADPYQRQTRRLQQRLAVEAASMPVMHVAALHGLSWLTVRRAEERAIERWEMTRPAVPLRQLGVDEKWLGRRHNFEHKFVTIVSNLETGEPVWIGKGRDEITLRRWLQSLSAEYPLRQPRRDAGALKPEAPRRWEPNERVERNGRVAWRRGARVARRRRRSRRATGGIRTVFAGGRAGCAAFAPAA
jgi:hypothetical protein